MLTIAFAGQKGGVGKSTATFAVACEYMKRGKNVLIVNADPQGSLRTWAEVAAEAGRTTPSVIQMGSGMHLPQNLPRVAKNFDRIIIDCPPHTDAVQRSALMACDLAVLPCGPQAFDVWALAESMAQVKEAQALRPALVGSLLINKKQSQTLVGKSAREALSGEALPLLKTEWGYRVAYAEAAALGMGVTEYAPDDVASAEVVALVDELEALTKRNRHAKETRRAPSKA